MAVRFLLLGAFLLPLMGSAANPPNPYVAQCIAPPISVAEVLTHFPQSTHEGGTYPVTVTLETRSRICSDFTGCTAWQLSTADHTDPNGVVNLEMHLNIENSQLFVRVAGQTVTGGELLLMHQFAYLVREEPELRGSFLSQRQAFRLFFPDLQIMTSGWRPEIAYKSNFAASCIEEQFFYKIYLDQGRYEQVWARYFLRYAI